MLKLELIPMFKKPDSDEQLWVPTLNSCRFQPKVGAMVAVVTDNIDPVGIGRVRIKYKWQKKDDTNSSPWIRMAVPYASKRGAGMFFIPNKGDEVLVDFYNGNIDRPIIAGVLRNTGDERDTDMSYRWEKRREIMSATGQILAFKENGDYAFSSLGVECIPGLSTYGLAYDPNLAYLNTYFDELDEKNGFAKYMRGSLGMSDFYGTWNISGDTGGREVTISSNLGTISIDALNGISISAPLGDISISAKNISLEASNNINIQSGTQIARQRKIKKTFKDGSATGIYNTLKGVAKSKCTLVKVDFSLLRMVVEAIIPPVEGSLTLKSNRYLKLEAGEKAKAVDEARVDKFELGKYDDSKALIGKGISTLFGINKHNDLHEFIFSNREALLSFNTAINAVPAIIKNICSDRRRARQNIKGNKIYEEANNNGFELNALDGSLWGDLGKVETIEDLNAKTSEQIDTYLKAIIDGANDDRIKTIFENPASVTLDNALTNLGLPTDGTEDEKKTRFLEANKKRFVKMAWNAAHTAFQNASAAAKENFTNKVKDDLTAAMPINSDKTIIPQYNVPAKEIKKAEWETLFKTIGEAIWNLKEDGTDLPSAEFGKDGFDNSIVRIILLKIFNETGWYVYDKEYAKEQFSLLQATKDVFVKGGVQVPESNFVAATAALDLDYFADGHHEADWSTFQKSCKFMSEAWENPPKKHTSGLSLVSTLASEAVDVLGISDVFDEVTSIIGGTLLESTHIKSSAHGGRILMSNGEESWALKNDTGQLEQTSFDIGDKTWN